MTIYVDDLERTTNPEPSANSFEHELLLLLQKYEWSMCSKTTSHILAAFITKCLKAYSDILHEAGLPPQNS